MKQIVKTTKDDSIFGGVINPQGQRNGIRFEGTTGWIWVRRGAIEAHVDQTQDFDYPALVAAVKTLMQPFPKAVSQEPAAPPPPG